MASSHYRITSLDLPTCKGVKSRKNEQNIKSNDFQILDKKRTVQGCDHQHKTNYIKPTIAVEAFTGCSAGKRPSLGGGLDELGDRVKSLGRLRYLEFSDKNNKKRDQFRKEFES